jgi:hypothetical protein
MVATYCNLNVPQPKPSATLICRNLPQLKCDAIPTNSCTLPQLDANWAQVGAIGATGGNWAQLGATGRNWPEIQGRPLVLAWGGVETVILKSGGFKLSRYS